MTEQTLTLTFSEQEVAVLITAITTALNDSQRQLQNAQQTNPPNSENIQLFEETNKELTDLYNKIWTGTWST